MQAAILEIVASQCGATGAFLDAFVPAQSGGLDDITGLAFGLDNDLYVSSIFTDEVLRYDGVTGDFIDVFVPTGSGGLQGGDGLAFGSDGHLYVTGFDSDAIHRYDLSGC